MMHRCPGCGVQLPEDPRTPLPEKVTASRECWQAYSDLQCSTVALRDARFTHQHVVDAYAAQHAGEKTRGISVVFGLIGLYLALEKGFSGKEVQRAHMRIARKKRAWPDLAPPVHPAGVYVTDVLAAPGDPEREAMIFRWMAAVWESWQDRQAWVREITAELFEDPGAKRE